MNISLKSISDISENISESISDISESISESISDISESISDISESISDIIYYTLKEGYRYIYNFQTWYNNSSY